MESSLTKTQCHYLGVSPLPRSDEATCEYASKYVRTNFQLRWNVEFPFGSIPLLDTPVELDGQHIRVTSNVASKTTQMSHLST